MNISFEDARRLVVEILTAHSVAQEHAAIVADHLVDAASAGHAFAGLPRVLALVDNLKKRPVAGPIEIVRKSQNSLIIDGKGTNGYVTSMIGVEEGAKIAQEHGFAVVGIRDTWFSGRLAYYVERAARKGLVVMHTATTAARVAPHGGSDQIFGTNPIAFAFPCDPDPLVVDFGTGMVTWGEALLRQKLGRPLDPGSAVDADGNPTDDAGAALAGAFLPWGGHRGSGIALVIQVLGILCGGRPVVEDVADCGFFFMMFDPELLMPLPEFRAKVTELVAHIEASRPVPGGPKVRVPGRASIARRASAAARGGIEVDQAVFETLIAIRDEGRARASKHAGERTEGA